MNFIFGMRKYFRNSGFFKILYGYSALFFIYLHAFSSLLPAFLSLLQMLHGYTTCATCCMCCMCCMRMDYTRVAYATCATYFPIFSIVAYSCNINYTHSLMIAYGIFGILGLLYCGQKWMKQLLKNEVSTLDHHTDSIKFQHFFDLLYYFV